MSYGWAKDADALAHRRLRQDCPYPCPRCGSSNLRGHADNAPMGLTCNVCGWIRYVDTFTHKLYDALRQPPWTTAGGGERT